MNKLSFYLSRNFTFDAAHRIIDYSGKCENLHGHTYKLTVTITGKLKSDGMVLDFAILKQIVEENVLERLDHKYLNDVFENPTTEMIAHWIFEKLQKPFEEVNCLIYEVDLTEGVNNKVSIKNERRSE